MILGVPEAALALLDRPADPVVVDGVLQVGEFIGAVDLPVGAGGVDEDDVQVQVEQVRDRTEDLPGDLLQGLEQEVHRPIRLVVGEARQAFDRDPLGDPVGRRQFAARLQRPLRNQGEHDPLDRLPVQAAAGRDPADRRPDPEPLPQPVQRPRTAERTGVQDLHLGAFSRSRRLLRGEEPRDRRDQPREGSPVDQLRAAEIVDHLRDRATGLRVPLVVRQLQVAHHRPVTIRATGLPQVHAHNPSGSARRCRPTRRRSCAYTISAARAPLKPVTSGNAVDQARICLPTAEVRPDNGARRGR